jgi:hypothetical protein
MEQIINFKMAITEYTATFLEIVLRRTTALFRISFLLSAGLISFVYNLEIEN